MTSRLLYCSLLLLFIALTQCERRPSKDDIPQLPNGWDLPGQLPDWLKDFLQSENDSIHEHHSWDPTKNPFLGPYLLNLTDISLYHKLKTSLQNVTCVNGTKCQGFKCVPTRRNEMNFTRSCGVRNHTFVDPDYVRMTHKISFREQSCGYTSNREQNSTLFAMCRDVMEISLMELPAPPGDPKSWRVDQPKDLGIMVNSSNLPEGRRLMVMSTAGNSLLVHDFNLNKIVAVREGHLNVSRQEPGFNSTVADYYRDIIRHVTTQTDDVITGVGMIFLSTLNSTEVLTLRYGEKNGGKYNGSMIMESCFHINETDWDITEAKTFVTYRDNTTVIIYAMLVNKGIEKRIIFREFQVEKSGGQNVSSCEHVKPGNVVEWKIQGDFDKIHFDAVTHSSCDFDINRTLITVRNSESLWIFPYNIMNSGNATVTTGQNNSLNLSGAQRIEPIYTGTNIRDVDTFGECINGTSQSLWFALTDSNNLTLRSSGQFSQHRFDCPNLQLLSGPDCLPLNYTLVTGNQTNSSSIYNAPFGISFDFTVERVVSTTGSTPTNSTLGLLGRTFFAIGSAKTEVVKFQSGVTSDKQKMEISLKSVHVFHSGSTRGNVVSPNGQHLFVIQTDAELHIESVNQSINLCGENRGGDGVPELVEKQLYKKYCAPTVTFRPTSPLNITNYVRHFTMCSPNTHICPTFSTPFIEQVPPGYISDGHLIKICPKGSLCRSGMQYPCLRGFICPEEGTYQPLRCEFDPSFNTTCDRYGLSAPMPCPEGMLCLDPASPAIPAPPGFYLNDVALQLPNTNPNNNPSSSATSSNDAFFAMAKRDIASRYPRKQYSRRADDRQLEDDIYSTISKYFHQCPVGFWCPIASVPLNNDTQKGYGLLCPEGNFCSESSVLDPTQCETETHTTYCPAGSSAAQYCPDGKRCWTPETIEDCHLGDVCLQGSGPRQCQAGKYCPSPAIEKECPSGYFCRWDFTHPDPCFITAWCPKGTAKPWDFSAIIFMSLFSAGLLLWMIYIKKLEPKQHMIGNNTIPILTSEGVSHIQPDLSPAGRDDGSDDEFSNDVTDSNLIKAEYPLDIHIHNLSYQLGTRKIISGISGSFQRGKLSAIMGPSGCGKSTLLSILCGRVGQTTGDILINGTNVKMSKLKTSVGFVPQKEIMLRTLTVWETINFYARLKSSRGGTYARKLSAEIIDILGLNKAQHTILGDEKNRGISGGELKRVSIGIEMVGQPSILFLDEPTTGLDSTVALQLVTYLKKIASLDITVICVIHQPRAEIFKLFDNVLLLGRNGKPSYFGPVRKVKQYFYRLGYRCLKKANVADFLLDVASGKSSRETHASAPKNSNKNDTANRRRLPSTLMSSQERRQLIQDTFVESKNKSLGDLWSELTKEAYDERFNTIKLRASSVYDRSSTDFSPKNSADFPAKSSPEFAARSSHEKTVRFAPRASGSQKVSRNTSETLVSNGDTLVSLDDDREHVKIQEQSVTEGLTAVQVQEAARKLRKAKGESSSSDSDFKNSDVEVIVSSNMAEPEILAHASGNKIAPARVQFFWFMYRSFKHQIRTPIDTIVSFVLFSLVGLVTGIPARGTDVTGDEGPRSDYITVTILYAIGVGLISVQSSLRVFGPEQLILWRESRSGINRGMYYLAKNIAQLPFLMAAPAFATAFYILLSPALCPLWYFYSLVFSMIFATSGFGYLVSTTFPPENGLMIGILYPLISGIFAGGKPELGLVASQYGIVGEILVVVSYGRWHLESIFVKEIYASQSKEINQLMHRFLYHHSTIWRGPLYMLLIGLIFRILAFITLVLSDQGRIFADKQSIISMVMSWVSSLWSKGPSQKRDRRSESVPEEQRSLLFDSQAEEEE